jgi:hypothetical protein
VEEDILMVINHHIYNALTGLVYKLCLAMLPLFIFGTTQGQRITIEYQKKMLKMGLSKELPISYFDSLIVPLSTFKYNHKVFVNDTIENPLSVKENTAIYFEKKVIMVTSPNGLFLFQVKKKFITEKKDGIIEHYFCTKGNRLYLIIMVKNGVHIRSENSYYSTFYYFEDLK